MEHLLRSYVEQLEDDHSNQLRQPVERSVSNHANDENRQKANVHQRHERVEVLLGVVYHSLRNFNRLPLLPHRKGPLALGDEMCIECRISFPCEAAVGDKQSDVLVLPACACTRCCNSRCYPPLGNKHAV